MSFFSLLVSTPKKRKKLAKGKCLLKLMNGAKQGEIITETEIQHMKFLIIIRKSKPTTWRLLKTNKLLKKLIIIIWKQIFDFAKLFLCVYEMSMGKMIHFWYPYLYTALLLLLSQFQMAFLKRKIENRKNTIILKEKSLDKSLFLVFKNKLLDVSF